MKEGLEKEKKLLTEAKPPKVSSKTKLNHLELLRRCCWGRGIQQQLIHRTLMEFSTFVNDCIFGDKRKTSKSIPENKDSLEFWIEEFYEYCKEEYHFKDEDCPKSLREEMVVNDS